MKSSFETTFPTKASLDPMYHVSGGLGLVVFVVLQCLLLLFYRDLALGIGIAVGFFLLGAGLTAVLMGVVAWMSRRSRPPKIVRSQDGIDLAKGTLRVPGGLAIPVKPDEDFERLHRCGTNLIIPLERHEPMIMAGGGTPSRLLVIDQKTAMHRFVPQVLSDGTFLRVIGVEEERLVVALMWQGETVLEHSFSDHAILRCTVDELLALRARPG